MAVAVPKFSIAAPSCTVPRSRLPPSAKSISNFPPAPDRARARAMKCKATDVSPPLSSVASEEKGKSWVPVVPVTALPKGERRVIIQDGETVLLLWYKDDVFAIENRSPAEGAYSEGLLNAKLTQDGCIVCPTTDSTFDLQTGDIKEWYPKNPVLRALTPPLRTLFIYPVKIDGENIYISMGRSSQSDASTEIVFSGKANPGVTASDVNVDVVRMIVDEDLEGFGFTGKNELINGKAAAVGFLLLLDFELLTGKGLLKGTGFLDFIYSISNALQ
ncbi:rieske domain containing protein [Striga asiatica]|uniref:Rieske domain containing protein n=1 Tax=Striga asiatica TaxID=4170 RepID=A0A5A7PZ15_STRAF|nr:rieske domain containing protein [Striga asiatica]